MAIDAVTLGAANGMIKAALEGVGALAGKPCQIQSIEAVEGGSEITFLWEDNDGEEHTDTLLVLNGADGKDGKDGQNGADGKDGQDGAPGAPGQNGADGAPGRDGVDGKDGKDGKDGADGKDGEDYVLTAQDKADIAALVLAELPTAESEAV